MDLYKEGCFVLEAKQGSEEGSKKIGSARRHTGAWVVAMQTAEGQVRGYARTLPAPPPFLVVCDIGYCFDLFAAFDGSTSHQRFPDPLHNRIFLSDLGKHLDLFRSIFTDPLSLDPARRSAAVTRAVAARLAALAKELHAANHDPEQAARFLMRCLFTMFAEDVGLLTRRPAPEQPEKTERPFTDHLEKQWIPDPERFATDVEALWRGMNVGDYVFGIGKLLRFNGGLFTDPVGLSLTKTQLQLLLEAARCDWSDVEPAIFGTLLERALDPEERHVLGAHFTPRAYVERLVRPTIEEPVRDEWNAARAEALAILREGNEEKAALKAIKVVRDFHHRLCHIRVLDPACGSGNFLYVTLDLFKRIEAEVLAFLTQLGDTAHFLDVEGLSVTPQQFLGIEIKPWAKEIAELVLWIGYLQWHFRTHGRTPPREPVLHDYRNIECRDAVLAYDRIVAAVDPKTGKPISQWDGKTFKPSPVTGEDVPDERARVPLRRYVNPRRAEWPEAEFVVGNPPFIGNKRMRAALGDGYVEALRTAHADVPDSADYVMFWWNQAARLVRSRTLRSFGLITTNSITMTYNRGLVAAQLDEGTLRIRFAIPDHPWVDTVDGAAVRVAMSVVDAEVGAGHLLLVASEEADGEGSIRVGFTGKWGRILPGFRIGCDIHAARALKANSGLSFMGVILVGDGFVVDEEDPLLAHEAAVLRPYMNGGDLTRRRRGCYVIDFFGFAEAEAATRFPMAFQRVLTRVKPMREQQKRDTYRTEWWLFGEKRPALRLALRGLRRYVGTTETAKHRTFQFVSGDVLPDQKIRVVASDDSLVLGVLSSRVHVVWALAVGGTLEDRPVYNNSRCFEPYPFPAATPARQARIRELGESLDGHRKRQQALYPDLTITAMYNVLEKVRSGETLTAKEKELHEKGLVSVLSRIHDELDASVFDAYGWPQELSDEGIIERLVELNRERAEEESRGLVRWIRPEFQTPEGTGPVARRVLAGTEAEEVEPRPSGTTEVGWPKQLPARISAVRDLFRGGSHTLRIDDVVRSFKGAKKKEVETVLDSLTALGLLTAFRSSGERCWRAPAGSG